MLLRELFFREDTAPAEKQVGRTFNHLEDLAFLHNSAGAIEALDHLKEINTPAGANQIRMKWDGAPQIYWGRDDNGRFVLTNHNGWLRGGKDPSLKPKNAAALQDFIANQSGSPKTPEEKTQRDTFAGQFAGLWDIFEAATPKNFKGFVYADALFLSRPQLDANGVYNFHPNLKSNTTYHVQSASKLGKRISAADVMVVGHATFNTFGAPDNQQQPKTSFDEFNLNPQLIVLGPVYNSTPVKVDTAQIDNVEKDIIASAGAIDSFLAIAETPGAGLTNLKTGILYPFVNWAAKSSQLDNLSSELFYQWLKDQDPKKVSEIKKAKIANPNYTNALDSIFRIVLKIMTLKESVLAQLDASPKGEVWDTHGEGHVKYKGSNQKFSHVKFVPRRDIQTDAGTIPAWTP